MEMKKWSNPQLKNLKLVGTQTGGECTCGAKHGILVMSNNVHFCHSLGEWHEMDVKKQKDIIEMINVIRIGIHQRILSVVVEKEFLRI